MMKLGFWSVGLPHNLPGLADIAASFGFDGVNIRCTSAIDGLPSDEGNLSIEATTAEVEAGTEAFRKRNLAFAYMLAYVRPDGTSGTTFAGEVERHARLAARLGAPGVRLPTGRPRSGVSWTNHLHQLFTAARDGVSGTNVSAMFENHPGAAGAGVLLRQLDRFNEPNLGAWRLAQAKGITVTAPDVGVVEDHGRRDSGDQLFARLQRWIGVLTSSGLDVEVHVGGFVLDALHDRLLGDALDEALSNVAKHSAAPRVEIALALTDDRVALRIWDEGPSRISGVPSAGTGLARARRRFERLGGTLYSGTREGEGFEFRVELPKRVG